MSFKQSNSTLEITDEAPPQQSLKLSPTTPVADPVMQAHGLRKAYHTYPDSFSRLKQIIAGDRRQYYKEFVALDGLDFTLNKGEVLGVVGRNGAGKSTLLQLICGTLTPSAGTLQVKGRIAALLELGAGFNPEFSGRENVYFAAAIMGIERSEVDRLLEGIIEFSGIRAFIDQPVKTYSSGMYVRLAFAVATSVDPDILVIDEALSVGDGDFARRSFDRIMAMRDAGTTILFCSHSLYQIEVLCSRAIWLEGGKMMQSGPPESVIPHYQSFLDNLSLDSHNTAQNNNPDEQSEQQKNTKKHPGEPIDTDYCANNNAVGRTRLLSVNVAIDGIKGYEFSPKSTKSLLQVEVNFSSHLPNETPGVAIVIHSSSRLLVSSCASWDDNIIPQIDSQGIGHICVEFPKLPLLKGRYEVGVVLFCNKGIYHYDEMDPVAILNVQQESVARGFVTLPRKWQQQHLEVTENQRWRTMDASSQHEDDLLALFEDSFGHKRSIEEWRWKYKLSQSPGTVVYEENKAVAFNGAMPRPGYWNGKSLNLVHIGDSMVEPKSRGILTRRGPFYLSAHHFHANYVGPDKSFPLTFGFPNARHAKLGIKQKLYCQMDTVVQARWPAVAITDASLHNRPYTDQDTEVIDILWAKMLNDCDQGVICSRDSHWITHRYCEKPDHNYQLYLVHQAETQQCLGLIVLKSHGNDGVELLDIVAPKANSNEMIVAAQDMCAQLQQQWLFGWFTPCALTWYAATQPIEESTPVIIAGSAVNDIEYSLSSANQWWLMGGDTDFR